MGTGASSSYARTSRYNEHVHDVILLDGGRPAAVASIARLQQRDAPDTSSLLTGLGDQQHQRDDDTEFSIHEAVEAGELLRLERYLFNHAEDVTVNETLLQTLTLKATQAQDLAMVKLLTEHVTKQLRRNPSYFDMTNFMECARECLMKNNAKMFYQLLAMHTFDTSMAAENEAHFRQLLLQPALFDREINKADLRADFGRVVGIRHSSEEVESEFRIVLDFFVSDLDDKSLHSFASVLVQHAVNSWVDIFSEIRHQHWLALVNAIFQNSEEISALLISYEQLLPVLRILHLLHPHLCLVLRIDHERPSQALGHHHSILNREIISRKPLRGPFAHNRPIHHELSNIKFLSMGHLIRSHLRHP